METKNKTQVFKDIPAKSIRISRTFNAPLEKVWSAYTRSTWLDQWWGPAPWRAETKSMNFTAGGFWLYAMVGPENEKHWARFDFTAINTYKNFEGEDAFCDESGKPDSSFPRTKWNTVFTETPAGTQVDAILVFGTEKDLQTLVEMGFEQGISIGLDQLDALLEQGKI